MTRATCPYCQNPHCPPVGDGEHLCPACGKTFCGGYIKIEDAVTFSGLTKRYLTKLLSTGQIKSIREPINRSQSRYMMVDLKGLQSYMAERRGGPGRKSNRRPAASPNHCPICGLESEGGELCQFCREEQATGKRRWYEINLTPSSSWRAGSLGVYR